jgi:HTH-type transcriptional regulator, sugar sensing transcriptional regulator
MNKEELIGAGLTKGEAEIYVSLLKLGKSTATKLTQETGIHRTYIYDLVEKLKEKGLISQITEDGKQCFQASEPDRIKEYLLEKIKGIEKIIPELNKIKDKTKEDTSVEVFKGKEGIKTILNDIIKEGKDYCIIGSVKEFEEVLPIFTEQFILRVNENRIREKVILAEGTEVIKAKNHEYRFLPKKHLLIVGITVYSNKVAFFIWQEPYIQILIKNKDIAKSYLTQFNLLWRLAKKENSTSFK